MAPANRSGCDQLDEDWDKGQTVGVIGRQTRITGLAKPAAMTDGADRSPAIVSPLHAPCRAGGVVQRGVQGKIKLHFPLQTIDHGACSTNSEDAGIIGDTI